MDLYYIQAQIGMTCSENGDIARGDDEMTRAFFEKVFLKLAVNFQIEGKRESNVQGTLMASQSIQRVCGWIRSEI